MNHLSIQDVVADAAFGPDEDLILAERMRALPPYVRNEVAKRAIMWGTAKGIEEWMKEARADARGFAMEGFGLGQDALTASVQSAVEKAIRPIVPVLQQELLAIVKPAAAEAANVVGPVVAAELKARLPMFAIIAGAVAAVLGVLGMLALGAYVVAKVR